MLEYHGANGPFWYTSSNCRERDKERGTMLLRHFTHKNKNETLSRNHDKRAIHLEVESSSIFFFSSFFFFKRDLEIKLLLESRFRSLFYLVLNDGGQLVPLTSVVVGELGNPFDTFGEPDSAGQPALYSADARSRDFGCGRCCCGRRRRCCRCCLHRTRRRRVGLSGW